MYRKTYRLGIIFRLLDLFLYIVLLPFVILIVGIFIRDGLINLWTSLVLLFAWGFWQVNSRRVVVSDDGIEYHTTVFSIKAAWENVESYRNVIGFGTPRWGLWLKYPALKVCPFLRWYISITKAFTPIGESVEHFIPLQPFGGINWQNSALMADVKRYLPHLFKETAS